jgi:hypothetical protein
MTKEGVVAAYEAAVSERLMSRLASLGYLPEEIEELTDGEYLEKHLKEIRSGSRFSVAAALDISEVPACRGADFRGICAVSPAFQAIFGRKAECTGEAITLVSYRLESYSPSRSRSIILLGGRDKAVLRLGHIKVLLERQTVLRHPGELDPQNWNVFLVADEREHIHQVTAVFAEKEQNWNVDIHSPEDTRLWMLGTRFFGLK